MVCIHCGSETHVINSRPQKRLNQVWRRRRCNTCQAVFTTEETTQFQAVWALRGLKNGVVPFSRDKLLLSVYKICEHRKTALEDARGLTDTIINKLRDRVVDGVLTRPVITQVTQVSLNRFDGAASVHYAAFHAS